MRPEHFCPGNPTYKQIAGDPKIGFNEAGAFLPRKRHENERPGDLDVRFNEAGAFLPRKQARLALACDACRSASMRPEHFCPGNPP